MYNVKEFNEMEAKALKDGLYIDPQLMVATPTFAAATCTVSDKKGKRIFRAVSGKSVARVTEQAIALALCAYYNEAIPAPFAEEHLSAEQPANIEKQPDAPQRNQSGAKATQAPAANPAGKKDGEKTIQTPAVGGSAGDAKKAEKPEAKKEEAADTQGHVGQAPAVNTANAGTDGGGAHDFRVLIGKYEKRDDNYITQMLGTEEGRAFLAKVVHIESPSGRIKPYVIQTKAYLAAHSIDL